MAIFPVGKTAREVQALRGENATLSQRVAELEGFVLDDAVAQTAARSYTGNAYTSYAQVIAAIARKYQSQDRWGCVQTGNIIDTRAAFVVGQGLTISAIGDNGEPGDPNSREMQFVRAFFEYNALDREMAQELAKEAEIEGCFLGALSWIEADGQVSLRSLSRVNTSYQVIHPANDYLWYQRVDWTEGSEPKSLTEDNFVYARFGGRIHKPNEPTPRVGKCLTEIESLSKALRDWREINRMYGAPIPHITCTDKAEVEYMRAAAKDQAENWRTRKLFIHTGQLGYLTPGAEAQAGIEREIITLAKFVSGTTGVPLGFLGFGDLVTKLGSGSEVTSDLVEAATSKERVIWIGAYQEIIDKAMALWNAHAKTTPLVPGRVKVSIPRVSPETWKRITETWLPLYSAGAISLQTLLTQIPDVNAAGEAAAIAAEKEENMNRFKFGREDQENEDEDGNDRDEEK